MYKIVLGDYMARQIKTRPPKIPFETKKKAIAWGTKTYGSGTLDVKISGKLVGWTVKKEM